MKKLILALALTIISSLCASAQSSDDYKKTEFYAGYSYGQAGVNFGVGSGTSVYHDRADFHGFNGSAVYNVGRYAGIKGDVSGTYNSGRFTFSVPSGIMSTPFVSVSFSAKNSLYNFLGGVQIKDNASKARVKPFAHALVGAAHRQNKIEGGGFTCITIIPCPASTSETGFAGAFGGGLDVRANSKVSIRVFQVDYNPVKFDRGVDHNLRLGAGIVF
jgi:hypothetical protein